MNLFRHTKDPDVDAMTASNLVTTKKATLLDVRETDEWEACHAPDAVHVPLGSLAAWEVANDRLVIVVCRSGARSAKAASLLRAGGMDVRNLSGGMHAWSAAGLPVWRDDGSSGVVA